MATLEENELKIQRLASTLDLFVNGQADESVAISNGRTVGTLASIDKRAFKTKYVQKIFDYSKLADAELDASGGVLIDVGNLVRVFGEVDVAKNRYYQVQDDKSLLQIDYTDIYDLKNTLPFPYNNKMVRQNLTQMQDPVIGSVLTYTVEPSSVKSYNIFLSGKVKVSSHKVGSEGMTSADFNMLISLKNSAAILNYNTSNLITLSPNGNTYPTTAPALTVFVDNDISPGNNTLLIRPTWVQSVFNANDPVMVEWFIDNIDKTPFY